MPPKNQGACSTENATSRRPLLDAPANVEIRGFPSPPSRSPEDRWTLTAEGQRRNAGGFVGTRGACGTAECAGMSPVAVGPLRHRDGADARAGRQTGARGEGFLERNKRTKVNPGVLRAREPSKLRAVYFEPRVLLQRQKEGDISHRR